MVKPVTSYTSMRCFVIAPGSEWQCGDVAMDRVYMDKYFCAVPWVYTQGRKTLAPGLVWCRPPLRKSFANGGRRQTTLGPGVRSGYSAYEVDCKESFPVSNPTTVFVL